MKRLIVLGIIVMMIAACSAAQAAVTGVALNLQVVAPTGSFHTPQVGWMTDTGAGAPTTNGNDAGWDGADSLPPPAGTVQMDIVNTVVGSSKVQYDFRAPIMAVGEFQIWRLKAVVANPDAEGNMIGSAFGLQASFQTGFAPANEAGKSATFYILNGNYSTQALAEAQIGNALAVLTPTASGMWESAAGAFSIAAPVYDPDNDTWSNPSPKWFTVYAKGLAVTSIPEPGSLLAMFSGLVGLVGFGIRRRR